MTDHKEIPDDVMEIAEAVVDRIAKLHVLKGDCVADVALAILAERERCAGVAELHSKAICDDGMNVRGAMKLVAKSIAAYIRK